VIFGSSGYSILRDAFSMDFKTEPGNFNVFSFISESVFVSSTNDWEFKGGSSIEESSLRFKTTGDCELVFLYGELRSALY